MGLADDLQKIVTKPSLATWLDTLDPADRAALIEAVHDGVTVSTLHEVAVRHGCPVQYAQFNRWVAGCRRDAR